MIEISVVIPTFNRCDQLRICLLALAAQKRVAMQSVEVIVVENGPKCGVKEMVDSLEEQFQSLSYVYETLPGVSRARNIGMDKASGDITIFIDDDEVPKENWLSELLKPFALQDLRVDIVAGDYEPEWESPRPEWLEDRYLGYYSAGLRWSDEPRLLQPAEWILEGNIAVRTELLRGAGGFDERLGRREDSLVSCEGAVFDKLRNSGAVAYYNPRALVSHFIHADRLNKGWLTRRLFAQGVSKSIMSAATGQGLPFPQHVSVKLSALLAQDPNSLEGEELLVFVQIFEILGFICHKHNVL